MTGATGAAGSLGSFDLFELGKMGGICGLRDEVDFSGSVVGRDVVGRGVVGGGGFGWFSGFSGLRNFSRRRWVSLRRNHIGHLRVIWCLLQMLVEEREAAGGQEEVFAVEEELSVKRKSSLEGSREQKNNLFKKKVKITVSVKF